MKTTAIAFLISASAFAAVPVIDADSVSVKQDGSRTVVISYKLEPASAGDTEPAIITADILTNGVSVGGSNLWTLSGDVNRIVTQGDRKILWQPNEEKMPEFSLPAAQVTAKITAWSTNSPPNYWVIDLRTSDSIKDRLADRYYPNAEQIPLTVTNKLYKTERLVFRRIPAKGVTWRQGASAADYSDVQVNEKPRYVTFSYDYYMAVFELTRAQYANLSRDFPYRLAFSSSTGPTDEDFKSARPLTGTPTAFQPNGIDNSSNFNPSGERIRTLTGNMVYVKSALQLNVDNPTVAEFEYACRAGKGDLWISGTGDFRDYAWYNQTKGDAQQFHEVGLKLSNDWGLYDIQGNVAEFALDWYYYHDETKFVERPSEPVWDPLGPEKIAAYRSYYGGHYAASKAVCRASYAVRMGTAQNMGKHGTDPSYNTGMRFVLIMP